MQSRITAETMVHNASRTTRLRLIARVLIPAFCVATCGRGLAADKNGVSPQTISLPSGPGSIQGLGESFQPQLNSGSGSYSISVKLPSGPAGFAPGLSLQYHTGNGNGCLGIGWKLAGPTMITRNMDEGLPLYVDAANGLDDDFDGTIDNPEEIDRFSGVDLEELVRLDDGAFRSEKEESFLRYERFGEGWRVRSKAGLLHEFGLTPNAQVAKDSRVFAWLLETSNDLNGNTISYRYMSHADSPGQKYLEEIRWAQSGGAGSGTSLSRRDTKEEAPKVPSTFYAAVMVYDVNRSDTYSDFRSGFEVRTGLRLSRIDVIVQGVTPSSGALVGDFNADGQPDALIRRYDLEYKAGALQSLLGRVTMIGSDGVTSLPSLTFEYTEWTPPDNVSSAMVLSSGDPLAALDSDNVELIDMNRDGLPDLLQATTSQHRVHVNLGRNASGRLAWDTVGTTVGNSPSLPLGATSVHLADHSADGESDLIHKVNDTTIQCFINTGERSWLTPVSLGNTDSWPRWPFENAGSRTLDTDHNRMSDILFTSDNSYRLWMLMPGGRYGREVALPVLSDGTQPFRFDAPGAKIADVNGDRIVDLAWVQSTRVVYWASCGRGNFEGPIILPVTGSLTSAEIARTDFADVNGDALADLIVVRPAASPNGIHYRLNLGLAGFDTRRTILGLPAVQAGDAMRCADMDGNGSVDLLISNSTRPAGTREQFVDFVPGNRPGLLRRIDNGMGLVTTLEYETSIDQMVRARGGGQPWVSNMPISIPVVARMIQDDSRGTTVVRDYTYRDPYFDPQRQEFRGFGYAEIREAGDLSAPTRITTHQFDRGESAECLKGKLLAQEVLDADRTLFVRTENSWRHRQLGRSVDGTDVCFPYTEAVDTYLFEGTPTAVRLSTRTAYDDYGNVVLADNRGIVGADGDEVVVEREFDYRPEIWLLDRPARERTYDGNGLLFAEEMYTYDVQGRLTEHRRWLDKEDRFVLFAQNEYDAFGNLTRGTNANGSSRSISYDPFVHAYPTLETVHLSTGNLVMAAEYDMGYGAIIAATDFSGAQSSFEYDPLARLTAVERPGGARTGYTYELGSPVSRVITKSVEGTEGSTHDTYDYVDGYGRAIGSKVEATDGRWRFLDAVTFNGRALPWQKWLPYYTSTPDYEAPDVGQSLDTLTYDVRDRVAGISNPDGTFTRTTYGPVTEQSYDERDTAGADTPLTKQYDGLGRLVDVIERNGPELYQTGYTWDALGNLTSMTDASGNQRRYEYDSLRRKVLTNDPDRGVMTYAYDDTGNLTQTIDARGQRIVYAYDEANRILSEDYVLPAGNGVDPIDVEYRYDIPSTEVPVGDGTYATAAFTSGRLASVSDASGEEHRSYDARGNVRWTIKRIRDPRLGVLASYTTRFAHDLMDRVTDVIYPDNDHLRLTYDDGAFLRRLDGGKAGRAIIAAADHEATGQLSHVDFGNGVSTTYSYDARSRLSSLVTVSAAAIRLIENAYSYDAVSNITQIVDRRPVDGIPDTSRRRNSQTFVYDDLYRIHEAHIGTEQDAEESVLHYQFDAIGNLIHQSASGGVGGALADDPLINQGARSFGGAGGSTDRIGRNHDDPPGPHALTATEKGATLQYDPNGNILTLEGAELVWDAKNRLTELRKGKLLARYTYDYASRRVSKATVEGNVHAETLYVDQYFELRPGDAPVKYVFNGPSRVAQVKGTLDPGRPRLQRFRLVEGWNLITLSVSGTQTASQILGLDARGYRWSGTQYEPVDMGQPLPVGEAVWVQVSTSRIASALGAYTNDPTPIALPQGQGVAGWPRLERLRPAVHGAAEVRVAHFDAMTGRWMLMDSQLPNGLADTSDSVPASSGIWYRTAASTELRPERTAADDVLFYHGDHLSSASVVTDVEGHLRTETAYYPFGHPRLVYEPNASSSASYGFADKEREPESGLQNFGMRYYVPHLAMFTQPDSRFVEFTDLVGGSETDQESFRRFVTQPQMGNVYSYGMGNPAKYVDLDGREIEVSEVLRKDVPLFKEAWKLLESTDEGKRLLKSLGGKDFKVYVRASLPKVKDAKVGRGITALGQEFTGPREGKNLKDNEAAALINIRAHWDMSKVRSRTDLVKELADTVFHELRHAEADYFKQHPLNKALEAVSQAMPALGIPKYDPYKAVHNELDAYSLPSQDPSLAKFEKEIGLAP